MDTKMKALQIVKYGELEASLAVNDISKPNVQAKDVLIEVKAAGLNRADLMRVRGVGSEYSDLLEQAGVDTVKELRNRNAANLAAKMVEVNDAAIKKTKKSIVRRTPAESEVERWVAHAKKLAPAVSH